MELDLAILGSPIFGLLALVHKKPRLGVENRPKLGKTVATLLLSTPNHVASVAKYWSIAVVGIQRPVLVSSGPFTAKVGNVP